LDEEIKIFNETRTNLINQYGARGEDGELIVDEKGNCSLKPESIAAFNKELTDLLNTVIEVNADKISINDLENGNFTPNEIMILEPFIEE